MSAGLIDLGAAWQYARDQFAPRPQRWANPGELAAALDPTTIQTPALDVIDGVLADVAAGSTLRLMISMAPQEGKLIADDTPVPTPDGWVRHGDLRPGSIVFHPSGRQIRVTEVHEPATATMRVHFSDHTSVLVHPAHEWTVWRAGGSRWVTLETRQIALSGVSSGSAPAGKRGHKYRYHLPLRDALDCPDADLPIDPYTLGVWLGDGSTGKACVTHHPNDRYTLPYPESARCVHQDTGIITTYYAGGMKLDLERAEVYYRKHIPAAYLRASIEQRRALLAGLIDTDGHVTKVGQISFDNANAELVRAVAELIRTLGYRAHVHRPTPPKLTTSGIQGRQEMWRVTFTPHDQGPARLTRKAATNLGRRERVAIIAIEEEAGQPGRCITVDSEDGLYLVGPGMLPTHNSERASRRFPTWILANRPETRIAIVSYAQRIARRWGETIRDDIVAHGAKLDLAVKPDAAADDWHLIGKRGGVYCTGIGGPLTGRAVDLLVLDDPYKDGPQADSKAWNERVQSWWTEVAVPRLGPGVAVVVIQTRWRQDDLTGWLQAREDGDIWRVVNIPAQADHDPGKGETDLLGREPGEYMISARGRSTVEWDARKKAMGTRAWTALCQGRPAPATGDIFKADWWQYYEQPQWIVLPDGAHHGVGFDEIIISVDCAFKDTDAADYVALQVWGRRGVEAYLLDQVHDRLSFTETVREFRMLCAKWPQVGLKLIEDAANGAAVVNMLHRKIGGIVPVTPDGSKVERAFAITPFCEAGNVYFPAPELCLWIYKLVEETKMFPRGKNDDMVDALTQALNRLLLNPLITEDTIVGDDDQEDPEGSISEY